MKKHIPLVTVILCGLFLYTMSIANLFTPQKTFSTMENRYLAKFPSFSFSSLWKGDFIDSLETWFQDQFIARDTLISIKAATDYMMGFGKTNNVYFGKDGYLIPHVEQLNASIFESNIKKLKEFASSQELPLTLLPIPSKYNILQDKLPLLHYDVKEDALLEQLSATLASSYHIVDVATTLKQHQQEPIYFKTDHHWTALGSYYAYEAYKDSIQQPVEVSLSPRIGSTSFKGTLYSKSKAFWYGADEVVIYDEPNDVRVELEESGEWHDGVYYWENLEKQDAYTVFLDGNHAIVKLQTASAPKKHVLLIKDSFAHAFAPYLTHDASMITMIDLRYYKASISEYIKEHQVDEVIFLYSMDSLTTQTDISFLR